MDHNKDDPKKNKYKEDGGSSKIQKETPVTRRSISEERENCEVSELLLGIEEHDGRDLNFKDIDAHGVSKCERFPLHDIQGCSTSTMAPPGGMLPEENATRGSSPELVKDGNLKSLTVPGPLPPQSGENLHSPASTLGGDGGSFNMDIVEPDETLVSPHLVPEEPSGASKSPSSSLEEIGTNPSPTPSYIDGPVSGFSDGPISGTNNGPVSGLSDGPVSGFSDGPISGTNNGPVSGLSDGPISGTNNGPVSSFSDGTGSGTNNGPLTPGLSLLLVACLTSDEPRDGLFRQHEVPDEWNLQPCQSVGGMVDQPECDDDLSNGAVDGLFCQPEEPGLQPIDGVNGSPNVICEQMVGPVEVGTIEEVVPPRPAPPADQRRPFIDHPSGDWLSRDQTSNDLHTGTIPYLRGQYLVHDPHMGFVLNDDAAIWEYDSAVLFNLPPGYHDTIPFF